VFSSKLSARSIGLNREAGSKKQKPRQYVIVTTKSKENAATFVRLQETASVKVTALVSPTPIAELPQSHVRVKY
jgi:hypothetical protein